MKTLDINTSQEMYPEFALFINDRIIATMIQTYITHPTAYHSCIMGPNGKLPQSIQACLKTYRVPNRNDPEVQKRFIIQRLLGHNFVQEFGKETEETLMGFILPRFRLLDASCIAQNPYNQKISVENRNIGRFSLGQDEFKPCELAFYNTPAIDRHGVIVPRAGIFTEPVSYPLLREHGEAWMSITPTEILTMERPVNEATGNVLTLGLGLGYYAYMAHLKPEVSSVTVIERSPDVIDMFRTAILPQFDRSEKIHIVQADAFDYLDSVSDGQFDYCFVDIWKGYDDIDLYLKMKMAAKRFVKMKMAYWIEDSIVSRLLEPISALALDQISTKIQTNKALKANFDALPMPHRRALRLIVEILSQTPITTAEQFRELFTVEKLISIIDREDFVYKSPGPK